MKFKTTSKALRDGAINLKCAGYCDLHHLLSNHSATAYTSGIYGWNFDVFEVYGVTICTGYRGMPGERCDGIAEFEKKAEKFYNNWDLPYEKRRAKIEKLLQEFCILNGGRV